MLRSDFSDVERAWRRRRLFGPPPPRSRPGLWLIATGLLVSGMYLAAQTLLPLGTGKPAPVAAELQSPNSSLPPGNSP